MDDGQDMERLKDYGRKLMDKIDPQFGVPRLSFISRADNVDAQRLYNQMMRRSIERLGPIRIYAKMANPDREWWQIWKPKIVKFETPYHFDA